ncbi:TadE/TadG family type IV pilus assembly protein [Sphingopyxis solisilvae]|uniref:TadE/TadG family type IV pilus assembly protein n=1 Tax=Sphingopyxis solisilvae TaxID=1886788 RepID=UPI0018928A80|nr:hypothetical protein [Sphingopyxis solisilvae]
MTARIAHRLRRIRTGIVRLARDSGAVVMIEMAFCIPFLILVGFAGIELANLTLTHTRVSQIGLSAADNASRIAFGSNLSLPRVREVDINEVFVGVEQQAQGMDFRNNGRIILSSLERNADGGQWIHWQRCYGNLPITSAYGPQGTGATGTGFPGMGRAGAEVTAADGTAVMFVEIIYDYRPMIGATWFGTPRIRSTAAFNIREGRDLSQVYNPAPTAPVSNCS